MQRSNVQGTAAAMSWRKGIQQDRNALHLLSLLLRPLASVAFFPKGALALLLVVTPGMAMAIPLPPLPPSTSGIAHRCWRPSQALVPHSLRQGTASGPATEDCCQPEPPADCQLLLKRGFCQQRVAIGQCRQRCLLG